ncbi:hypothetical protein TRVA0_003S04148 [Trichomonascus vanleenenianus]|uniref:uncharacterized protein n=1 Tax=Trichomonascus vanleenenianus TaxID=2268995 RepID=UPI003EC9AE5F
MRGVLRPDKISLSKPLAAGGTWKTPFGEFSHDQFIGQVPRMVVANHKNDKFIVTHPTFEDYIVNRRRDAQPIYPYDAAAIVTLADIHVESPGRDEEGGFEKLHFLEAGTGHGSLTLAICKAIHAANPKDGPQGAVLHSIDRNPIHSRTGRKNVEEFRRGMYARDVEFELANSPGEWLESQAQEQSGSMFKLSGAFLDLPAAKEQVIAISKYLKVDAPLIVFCPSVTQIQEIVEATSDVPLAMVDVVELMPGMGGSMRSWDVRKTKIKETGEVANVCRPRVGMKVVGGGFVGVFRRLNDQLKKL